MSVALTNMRAELMPGLQALQSSYALMKEQWAAEVFNSGPTKLFYALPEPTVSLPVAAAMGAVALVIKNPVVSRRWWRASS